MDKPRIKPLIWYGKPEGQDVRIGRCGDIAYSVRFDMDNWGYTRKGESGLIISYKGGPIFQCEADAIDGADVDHKTRILAALEPATVRICQKCGHPENNHPYRHMFVALAQEDT